jgi:hypothetical protein
MLSNYLINFIGKVIFFANFSLIFRLFRASVALLSRFCPASVPLLSRFCRASGSAVSRLSHSHVALNAQIFCNELALISFSSIVIGSNR